MRRPKPGALLGALAGLLVLAAVVGIANGSVHIPYSQVLAVFLGGAVAPEHRDIILQVRVPRVLVAGLVGAGLAASGAAMQGLFRNPMADPGIIGVSAGGALGGVLALTAGVYGLTVFSLPVMAFAGALGATLAVYTIARALGRGSPAALLLTGMAVSAFLGAMVSLIITLTVYNQEVLREIVYWLSGGLEARSWRHVRMAGPPILFGLAVLIRYSRELNLLLLGDEEATALGVRVAGVRRWLLLATALTTGAAVSVSGIIGFVGLVVPHMVRLVAGPDHRLLIPAGALGGASFLILADTLARVIIQPAEVRVGIITACAGAPFFLWLLYRNRRRLAAQI
ncbi:MAG TPA: iron chelate uptake ABC transporter family permease subunit [Symbiobacteriaceae bacterium]|jgi:iron complex transport system permease protein